MTLVKRLSFRLVLFGLVLAGAALLLFMPRQFGFIDDFGGRKGQLFAGGDLGIVRSLLGGSAGAELAKQKRLYEAFDFKRSPDRVLDAMIAELESCGWKVERIEPAGSFDLKGGVAKFRKRVTFTYRDKTAAFTDDVSERGVTCKVMVPRAQSLFTKLWRELKNPF